MPELRLRAIIVADSLIGYFGSRMEKCDVLQLEKISAIKKRTSSASYSDSFSGVCRIASNISALGRRGIFGDKRR